MTKITVYGENHSKSDEVKSIAGKIRKLRPNILLHELLVGDMCFNSQLITNRLNDCKEGGLCDPRINKSIYELGLELRIPIVGIDCDPPSSSGIEKRTMWRERHMVDIIERVIKSDAYKSVAIVVGDIHLRTETTEDMQAESALVEFLKKQNDVTIHRSAYTEIA